MTGWEGPWPRSHEEDEEIDRINEALDRRLLGKAEAEQSSAKPAGDGDGAEGTAVEAHPHTVDHPSTITGHLTD